MKIVITFLLYPSSSSSEEELQFSDEDQSDEAPDVTWSELAKTYAQQLQQSREARPSRKRSSSASSGSDTETVGASDADWETDSATERESQDGA